MEIGDVYLPEDKTIDDHPRIVISDPELNSEQVVLVNFTGFDGDYRDHSCVLEIGEYDWLTKKTCISYKDACVVSQEAFDKLHECGLLKKLHAVSDSVLCKILEGAGISDELPNRCRRILAAQNLID